MGNDTQLDIDDDDSIMVRKSSYCIAISKISVPRTEIAAAIWLLIAAVSLLTTTYLLTNGFHFPMYLLFLQLVGALTLRLIRWACCWAFWNNRVRDTPSITRCQRSNMMLCFLYISCVSGALLCGHQAINHLYNLPMVTMVLSLDCQSMGDGSGQSIDKPQWRVRTQYVAAQMLVLSGIIIILLFDFRLCGTGVVMLLLSAILNGLARLLLFRVEQAHAYESDDLQTTTASALAHLDLSTLGLLGALLSASFWCHFREQQFSHVMSYNPWTSHIPMFALNLGFTSVALDLGGHFFRKSGFRPSLADSGWLDHGPYGRLTMSVALVSLVSGGSMLAISPPVMSSWQWLGFGLASLGVLSTQSGMSIVSNPVNHQSDPDIECKLVEKTPGHDGARSPSDDTKRSSQILLAIVTGLACAALLLHSTTAHISSPSPSYDTLDRFFPPTHTLDVVISRYDEPASEVARHINEILTLPNIQSLDPTIRIYNKGVGADNSSTFRLQLHAMLCVNQTPCPRMIVETLENIGRESHTYLRHITTRWDALADHMIFMQAGVHRGPSEYTRRIQDYFVPSTGFLSLAKVGVQCSSCDHCYNKDWSEEPGLLHEIYDDFNNGTECKDLVLTYRGQFIVSAERMRRNEKETYQRWLDQLANPQSQIHTVPYIESTRSVKEDSLSAPRAGFTLERTWGVMFQCSEKRIADRYPSLLSGIVCSSSICGIPALEDCQCLD